VQATAIRGFVEGGGSVDKLMAVDRFFWELLENVPSYDARLKALAFKLGFPTKLQELRFGFLRIRKANRDLDKNSAKFVKLLEVRPTVSVISFASPLADYFSLWKLFEPWIGSRQRTRLPVSFPAQVGRNQVRRQQNDSPGVHYTIYRQKEAWCGNMDSRSLKC